MKKCPKCNYLRKEADDRLTPITECPSCGVIYSKYEEFIRKKELGTQQSLNNNHNSTAEETVARKHKNVSIEAVINRIKQHKLIAFIITLLTVCSISYYLTLVDSYKYNLLMNLTEDSTKEDIYEAYTISKKMYDLKLIDSAYEHICELQKKMEKSEDNSKKFQEKYLAICTLATGLASRGLILEMKY